MTQDRDPLEEMAEAAADDIAGRPQAKPVSITTCLACFGTGLDRRSRWAYLWGGWCWVCGGWKVVEGEPLQMRGPFAPRPGRYGVQGGQR